MHRHCSFGTTDLVAVMTAHRTLIQNGAKPESLQQEIARIGVELAKNRDQPTEFGKASTEGGGTTRL